MSEATDHCCFAYRSATRTKDASDKATAAVYALDREVCSATTVQKERSTATVRAVRSSRYRPFSSSYKSSKIWFEAISVVVRSPATVTAEILDVVSRVVIGIGAQKEADSGGVKEGPKGLSSELATAPERGAEPPCPGDTPPEAIRKATEAAGEVENEAAIIGGGDILIGCPWPGVDLALEDGACLVAESVAIIVGVAMELIAAVVMGVDVVESLNSGLQGGGRSTKEQD